MSAGAFKIGRYAADYNQTTVQIHPIRIQPETNDAEAIPAVGTTVTNLDAGSALNNPISAVVSQGRRALGLTPRLITLKNVSGLPATYIEGSVTRIPALTQDFYNACIPGTEVDYLGGTWEVVGRSPESVK